jgi:hypothetical protein
MWSQQRGEGFVAEAQGGDELCSFAPPEESMLPGDGVIASSRPQPKALF